LGEKNEEKKPLGRRRRRWENNIKMDHSVLESRVVFLLVSFFKDKEFPIYIYIYTYIHICIYIYVEYEAVLSPETVWTWEKRI